MFCAALLFCSCRLSERFEAALLWYTGLCAVSAGQLTCHSPQHTPGGKSRCHCGHYCTAFSTFTSACGLCLTKAISGAILAQGPCGDIIKEAHWGNIMVDDLSVISYLILKVTISHSVSFKRGFVIPNSFSFFYFYVLFFSISYRQVFNSHS